MAIEGEFGIFTARDLRERLLALMDEGDELEIDLSAVTEMDSAGVQLMLAAKREAQARDKSLRFTGHSPAVDDLLALCDLAGLLGDPAAPQTEAP
ncbi:MAG: STAS domain-containing protein [Zoogloea sp.]|nr:STAS domain-containing protein [Zoogloea sp.]